MFYKKEYQGLIFNKRKTDQAATKKINEVKMATYSKFEKLSQKILATLSITFPFSRFTIDASDAIARRA